ncbi:TRAG family protein [Paenibacillus faecis]|uniref:TRAG family protein n=1 Tax=Paenibacillus faecis TaxID=862114 RepID=A0A5D0CYH5_9BACL|nr:TRAG family protein [Paenibacillus faecis]TYA14760.1 TRAG family protein [Paenibacillus faecis]
MKTKQKIWIAVLLFTVGGVLNLFISTAIHRLLSGTSTRLVVPPIADCLDSLLTTRPDFLLFGCMQGFVLLLAVLYFLANSQPYQSKLRKVAPGIETPVPTGQHQHGSARWLQEDEWPRAFDHCTLELRHPSIRHLLNTGYDDLQFLKSSEREERSDAISSEDDPQS